MKFRPRALLGRTLVLLAACTLSAGLLEGLLSAFAWFQFGAIDVAELERLQTGNEDAAEMTVGGESRYATYYPHPYLAYVHNEKTENVPGGRPRRLNNVGFIGRDFPLRKDPEKFTILLTGGSVACQVGEAGEGGRSYLEIALNDRYSFGRPVVVLNGGMGGWMQPQQAVTTLLYADVADAVVTLDGFNEKGRFYGYTPRLELPSNTFQELNPVARHGFAPLAAAWQAQELKRFALNHQLRTVYFATRLIRSRLESSVEQTQSGMSVRTMFDLPAKWSNEDRIDFNYEQYKKYLQTIDALAELQSARVAHFIQPCPAVGKTLTPHEQNHAGDLNYRSAFQTMADGLMTLKSDGVPIFDLRNVFEQTTDTVYNDQVHCRFEPSNDRSHEVNFTPSPGYKMISDAMADRLAELWSIPAAK